MKRKVVVGGIGIFFCLLAFFADLTRQPLLTFFGLLCVIPLLINACLNVEEIKND